LTAFYQVQIAFDSLNAILTGSLVIKGEKKWLKKLLRRCRANCIRQAAHAAPLFHRVPRVASFWQPAPLFWLAA
jgi:hypothetical protein